MTKLTTVKCKCGNPFKTDSTKLMTKCPKCGKIDTLRSARKRYVLNVTLKGKKSCCW